LEFAVIRGRPPVLVRAVAPDDDEDDAGEADAVFPVVFELVVAVFAAVEASVADAEGPAVMVTGFKEISSLARVVVSLGWERAPVLGITSVQTAVVVPPIEQTMRPALQWMRSLLVVEFSFHQQI
jgi:hypothetical protein